VSDPVARTRETYDVIAPEYAARTNAPGAKLTELMAAFTERLPRAAMVLDAGCGPGRDTRLLRAGGLRAVGVDLALGMLRMAGPAPVAVGDMRRLPIRDLAVDGVWCQAALLHVPRADVPAVLAEFARVTCPGGVLHLGVSEGDGEGWEGDAYGSDRSRWYVHHRSEPLSDHLEAAGWRVCARSRAVTKRRWLYLLATRTS